MATVRILDTDPTKKTWPDTVPATQWYHWPRYERLLRSNPAWKSEMVDSVASESFRILRRMPDPNQDGPFQGRGLVVGYVQSGKTANYTAVAARAVDAGYRIVIVLSGIHDSLRNQTQMRLERELTGHQPGGVGEAEVGHQWVRFTTPDSDFKDVDVHNLQSQAPFLIVAKKNVTVLRRLDRWLESASRYLATMPILMIDDEADQASINTRGNREPDPSIGDEDEEEDDEETKPSTTNGLIRSILLRAPKAAYIAYTATPFANILINPNGVDRRVGEDLFPKDFVLQLPRPEGYTGTEELFGVSAQGREVMRLVADADVQVLRGPARRRRRSPSEIIIAEPQPGIPQSLCDAVLDFCVAGGIRTLRCATSGQPLKAHTMLVHVSQRKDDQRRIAEAIDEMVGIWRYELESGKDLGPLMATAWENLRTGVKDPPDDAAVIAAAVKVLRTLVILTLNSDTAEELEYDANPGRHVIAVGGNRLSRGLTLEGLTVSYFLRTATMCDTLLQMARWYGFRKGYDDLIRIWTTDGIARWFGELALVEQAMRDSIQALEAAGRRPDQMAIRLRAHSDLLLTARNKATMAVSQRDSWSGEHPQTVLLPIGSPDKIRHNRDHTDAFIRALAPTDRRHGGFLAHDVAPETVAAYLRGYAVHDDTVAFRPDPLADWIMARSAADELTNWTVFVASPEEAATVDLGGCTVGLVERRMVSTESIGTLLDPRHEGVDLAAGPGAYRREGGSYDADAMRRARPVTQGLLIIYPLDPIATNAESITDAVIALGLSLPHTSDQATEWIVNAGVSDV